MKFRSTRIAAVAGLGACAALALTMTTASAAASTYTVKAGSAAKGAQVALTGATTGASPQLTFVDQTSGTTLNCASSTITGLTHVGTGLSGTHIAQLNGAKSTFTGCTGPFSLKFTVTGSGTWYLNATTGNTSGVYGALQGIHAAVSDPGSCTFNVAGGIPGRFSNSSSSLSAPGTNPQLTISNVNGCFGAVNSGDKATFQAVYKITPTSSANSPLRVESP